MREIRSSGSVRGASGDGRPYRERNLPVSARPGEGPLTEPIPAARPWHANRSSCSECMDRLPFASEVVLSESLICIRPVDRHAGRGLDGSTRAPLISLADRPPSGH